MNDNYGRVVMQRCTVSGNRVAAPALSYGGGIVSQGTSMLIDSSTISGNETKGVGGGSGLFHLGTGPNIIRNSTFSGNRALGSSSSGAISESGRGTQISNSTVAGNVSDSGSSGIDAAGTVYLRNSLVATRPGATPNCQGQVITEGHNLDSDGSCGFTGPGDLSGVDPRLGPLKFNGGPTQTHALQADSPAVDAGDPGGGGDELGQLNTTDQRGGARPGRHDTGACDMGAFERQQD
jgi:hypothetical protein